jgi:hypothetical protein
LQIGALIQVKTRTQTAKPSALAGAPDGFALSPIRAVFLDSIMRCRTGGEVVDDLHFVPIVGSAGGEDDPVRPR